MKLVAALLLLSVAGTARAATVLTCSLDGVVDDGSAGYLKDCVSAAEARGAAAVLVRVDTPGGSMDSMRTIVQAFLGAEVPVLAWVGPSGARAGSAGVFITMAAHVAAMAPATEIGAAHPVVGPGGEDPEKAGGQEMARKVENDAAAFASSIASQRGRNAAWAEKAVRESASLPADEAVKQHVVDFEAATPAAVLEAADGRTVRGPHGPLQIHTSGATIETFEPSLAQRLAHGLATPALAYLLFLLGGLGLAIEFSHPGGIVPGVLGTAFLVLALMSFSALPISIGAVMLIVLGFAFIGAELFVGHGYLALGGVVMLVLGGVLLVDQMRPGWYVEPGLRVPLSFLLPIALVLGGAAGFVVFKSAKLRRLPPLTGEAGLVGQKGRALTEVGPAGGDVFVHGERWRAVSERTVPEGRAVVVRGVDGLTVHVEEVPA